MICFRLPSPGSLIRRPRSARITSFTPLLLATLLLTLSLGSPLAAQDAAVSRRDAALALERAVQFYQREVACQGGYLWRYSGDLQRREGEGKASPHTVWVQPPGTPTVGQALLDVYHLTGDTQYLLAARKTGEALIRGQLQSGGWDYRIEFGSDERRRYAYRADHREKGRNVTTLDDNTTQSALSFLIQLDRALDFADAGVHAAVTYGLDALIKAQYPNGAWPQRYDSFPDAEDYPVLKASYPESWSRTYPSKDYRDYYTFNDNSIADTIKLMFEAWEVYGDDRYRQSAEKAGAFILLAQMPAPQPAWAQQYDHEMHPAWARKFEPPAITGGESQGVLWTLLMLFDYTGDEKYLQPIEPALDYLEASQLEGGGLARFYELQTNRPLYFTTSYELTFDDGDLPTHYGFKVGSKLASIRERYQRARKDGPRRPKHSPPSPGKLTRRIADQARAAIQEMDERGAWVETGRLRYQGDEQPRSESILDMRTFADRIRKLAEFVGAQ